MSFDPPAIKNVILAAVAAVVLTLAVNAGYSLTFLAWRGMPPPEVWREMQAGAPYLILGLFLTTVGAILGARLAAGRAGQVARWTGLAVGVGLALVVVAVGLVQSRLDFWLPPNAAMAVVGGWLGSWLAGRV
jgi:uncharacterized membrane protein